MRLRNVLVVGALGFAAAALPAMASSETGATQTVEAVSAGRGYYGEKFAWSPTQAMVAAGGAVSFSTGITNEPHGIIWTGGPATPACNGVPVGENQGKPHWSGSCTFSTAGTYRFRCSVHEEMTGTITVTAAGVTTTTMTTTPGPSPTPTTTTTTPAPTPKPVAGGHAGNAKKLAKALKACRKKPKSKRAACIKRAHKRYGAKKK